MNLIFVIIALCLLTLLGFSFGELFSLFKNRTIFEKIAISFGLGVGISFFEMFAYSIMGIEWSRFNIVMPSLIFISISLFVRRKKLVFHNKQRKTTMTSRMFLGLLFITIAYVLFESILRPLPSWDGWSAFYLHGKAFYVDGYLNPMIIKYSGVTNPPLVAMAISYIFKFIGMVDDKNSLLIFSTFYIATAIIFFQNLRKKLSLNYSLVFTFLLISIPNLIRHAGNVDIGHADLILGYFILSSSIFIYDFQKKGSMGDLILAQFFLAFGALVKDEGLTFFVIGQIAIVALIMRSGVIKNLKYLLIGLFVISGWLIFKFVNNLPQNPFIANKPQLDRMLVITVNIIEEILNIQRWNLIWPIGGIILLMSKKKKDLILLILLFLSQLLVYISVYFTTPQDPMVHIKSSFDRLLLQILPLFLYCIALTFDVKKLNMKYKGVKILEILEGADNYNTWIAEKIEKYIESPALEIGAGIGNISEYFSYLDKILMTDNDISLVNLLKKKYVQKRNVNVEFFDVAKRLNRAHGKFKTVYAINVLEHIQNDNHALANINLLLSKKGRVVLLVPAKKFAFTRLDKNLGHVRRYEKKELSEKLISAGFRVESLEYFNIVGLLSWLVRAKISRSHSELKSSHVRVFDIIVPLLKRIEPKKGLPIGISLIAVGKKI